MDRAKLIVKVVVAAGLAFVWPGPDVVEWLRTSGPALPPPSSWTADPVDGEGRDGASTTTPSSTADTPGSATAAGREAETRLAAARRWFASVKPDCNAVEVGARLEHTPPPVGWEGQAHAAACLALAGRVDAARARIVPLSGDERWQAVGIVFEAGHPAADAGDEVAAGPLMELVVEFWPNHYMALYHAGAAAYERGDTDPAVEYLESFLFHYEPEDAWRTRALDMLAEMDRNG